MSLLSTIPKLVSLLCCLTLGLLIAPRPTEQISRHQHVAKLVQPDAIPSYISLSMYELDQDGDKLIPTVSCIYPGGTRSGNWGCSACIDSCTKTYLPIQRRGYIPQNQ